MKQTRQCLRNDTKATESTASGEWTNLQHASACSSSSAWTKKHLTTMSENNNNNQGGGNRKPRRNNNNNRNRNNNGQRRNSNNRRRHNRKPKPLKLTFWQKVLKALGLFNEEKAREAQRKQNAAKKGNNQKAPKSNVRNAKTGNADNNKNRRKPQPVPVESARLYVGNLSYDATEYDLEDLFKGIGTVKKVEIIYNRNTHKSKGYGFIQMLNTEEAKRAVEVLHDQPFMGRQLVVNGSKARKENDSANKETEAAIDNDGE